METSFSQAQLEDPALAEADRILRTCNHYGFCTATCPTYVLLGDELDAPRGRIDLMHAMLAKSGPPDADTVARIDRCLSCLACMTTCAVNVDYMHLVDIGRAHIEKTYRRPIADRLFARRSRLCCRIRSACAPLCFWLVSHGRFAISCPTDSE